MPPKTSSNYHLVLFYDFSFTSFIMELPPGFKFRQGSNDEMPDIFSVWEAVFEKYIVWETSFQDHRSKDFVRLGSKTFRLAMDNARYRHIENHRSLLWVRTYFHHAQDERVDFLRQKHCGIYLSSVSSEISTSYDGETEGSNMEDLKSCSRYSEAPVNMAGTLKTTTVRYKSFISARRSDIISIC